MSGILSLYKGVIRKAMVAHPGMGGQRISAALLNGIVSELAELRGVSAEDILGQRRHRHVAHVRQEVMYRLRSRVGTDGRPLHSYPEIGRALARDHTSCLHGVRAHKARISPEDRKCRSALTGSGEVNS
jgi:chromosomal replication initiation ATPase DnaA